MLLRADTVVTPERTLTPGWVDVAGDRIRMVGEGAPPARPDHDLGPAVVVPGFVDTHCHGGGGAAFTDGPDAARTAARTHLRHGTTSLVASLVTDTVDRLAEALADLAPLVEEGLLLGTHLEGPWLAAEHCGAHDPALLRDPDLADVDRLLTASRGTVAMVTLAPELPGALEAVSHLTARGVVAAVGHSHATHAQARAALLAGASVATHLFNGMRPLHHREPGIIGAALGDCDLALEIIADGVHLHPAVVRATLLGAPHRSVLVTDAMAAAGAVDGDYSLGPLQVRVTDGVARVASTGAIAGSTLTLDAAVRFAVHECGVDLDTAVRAATLTPAARHGHPDLGRIAPGCRADLAVLDAGLEVVGVLQHGRWAVTP